MTAAYRNREAIDARFNVLGPCAGPRGGGIGMVTQSIFEALAQVGDTRLVEHRFDATRARRRALYLRDWLVANIPPPALNVYCHLDLARLEAPLPRALAAPFAVFLHGTEVWKPLGGLARTVIERSSWLLANSETTVAAARRFNPWLPAVTVVPLGLVGRLPALGPWPRCRRVTIIGRLDASERQKGHDAVLSAWPRVVAACPDAELVIVGRGDDLPRLRKRVESERIAGVVFEGFVSEPRKWEILATSSAFAFPSTQEGFGIAAIEAAAVATPVIALRDTAVAEVFGPSSGAIYAEDATPDAIASALLALLLDPTEAQRVGARGRERVVERFLDEHFKRRVLEALALA